MADAGVELSEYEQLRLENIHRNQNFLTATLGLSLLLVTPIGKRRKSLTNGEQAKRTKVYPTVVDSTGEVGFIALRRSSRVATLPTINYTEVAHSNKSFKSESGNDASALHSYDDAVLPLTTAISGDLEAGTAIGWSPTERHVSSVTVTSGDSISSCASLLADVDFFLQDDTICKPFEDTGKAAVMFLSNYRRAVPRFNKYPGAVEWSNCVFLWVNIAIGSQYTNAFSAEGRHMMWYGGSKMHKDSKVIKRLVAMAAPVADGVDVHPSSGDCCLLFVRFEGAPYACLGRLRWIGLDLLSSPVMIKWELLDYDRFCGSGHFQRIIQHRR